MSNTLDKEAFTPRVGPQYNWSYENNSSQSWSPTCIWHDKKYLWLKQNLFCLFYDHEYVKAESWKYALKQKKIFDFLTVTDA